MANRRRGEVEVALGDRVLVLRLTLGALAEIETRFGAAGLAALGEKLAAGGLSARDLVVILGAAIRGGGQPLSDAEIAALPLPAGLGPVASAVIDLFALTFGGPEVAAAENPPPGSP